MNLVPDHVTHKLCVSECDRVVWNINKVDDEWVTIPRKNNRRRACFFLPLARHA